MEKVEKNPAFQELKERLGKGVLELFGAHMEFIHAVENIPNYYGQELLLRSPDGDLYRVLRLSALRSDGRVDIMDSVDIMDPSATRIKAEKIYEFIRAELDENDNERFVVATEPDIVPNRFERTELTHDYLEELLADLKLSTPVEWTPPHNIAPGNIVS